MTQLMPAVYFGHGNPMNALQVNDYTRGWKSVGASIPRPKAVLAISAHWYIPYSAVTNNEFPKTIHDFGGFQKELYQVSYPAPGNPELACRVQELLKPISVSLEDSWGLDHGTWSVLKHVFPEADIPVVQLSIDSRQKPEYHFELGKRLAPLREDGVLVAASGNLVHNLMAYAWGKKDIPPFSWALQFEEKIRMHLQEGNVEPVINYQELGESAQFSVPTPDHYLPLLYILGMRSEKEPVSFPVEGMDGGSVSMLTVRFGG